MGGIVTANFLVRHPDGDYQLKKEPEEVEQELIFMQDVKVVWKGLGRFHVENEKEVNARLVEHWQSRHMRHKVLNCWERQDLDEVLCQLPERENLTVGKLETIKPLRFE